MNTLGLLHFSKWSPKDFTWTLQETQSIHDSMNIPKIEFIAYIFISFFSLGIKTVLYLRYNLINGLVVV